MKEYCQRYRQKISLTMKRNLTKLKTKRKMKIKMFSYKFLMTSLMKPRTNPSQRSLNRHLVIKRKETDRLWKL